MNAALEEFAEQGYEKTSTNKIVKKAGIGKGMLFHYFNSKKELYYYLINYAIDYLNNEYFIHINESETDFIERYKQIAQVKMKAYAENPHVFNFFASLYINEAGNLSKEIKNKIMEIRELGYSILFNNIDTSLFREDIAPDMVIKLIHWTLEGYENEIINRLKGKKLASINFDPYWDELYEYLDVLKKIYYKQGG